MPLSGLPILSTGPRVFMDYDQPALDAAYNQAVYAPHSENVRKRFVLESDAVRKRIGEPLRVAYGPAEIEKIDIYKTRKTNAPILFSSTAAHGIAVRHAATLLPPNCL